MSKTFPGPALRGKMNPKPSCSGSRSAYTEAAVLQGETSVGNRVLGLLRIKSFESRRGTIHGSLQQGHKHSNLFLNHAFGTDTATSLDQFGKVKLHCIIVLSLLTFVLTCMLLIFSVRERMENSSIHIKVKPENKTVLPENSLASCKHSCKSKTSASML